MTAPGGDPTPLFHIYRTITRLLSPVAWHMVSRKLRGHGVAPERTRERLGNATLPRPAGTLIWFHAASVGESLSVLTLITRLGERLPETEFVITSGTATSAELIGRRMPPRTRHQFAPLDAPGPVQRFLRHWRPDAAVFVESELWPVMLHATRASGARLALLNARLSQKSVDRWTKWPDTAAYVLGQFDILLSQNQISAQNLRAMGADPARVAVGVNLKSTSAPLPVDDAAFSALRSTLGQRPLWVASSTHPGEEEIVLQAHRRLLQRHPDLCLLLVPRHPERGNEVAGLIASAGFDFARRSTGEPLADQPIYLADTLGETGTWYALSPLVFLAGSLQPIGGHNPFEPAQAGAAVITGPHVTNFSETFAPLISLGGAVEVSDAAELAQAVSLWLDEPTRLDTARQAAARFVQGQQTALDRVVDKLCTALHLDTPDA